SAGSPTQAPSRITPPGTEQGPRPRTAIPRRTVSAAYARTVQGMEKGAAGGYAAEPSQRICAPMAAAAPRQMLSVRILPAEHHDHGLENDLQIEQQRPVAQVLQVVLDARLHLLHGIGLAAEAADLRQPGDARAHLVAHHVAADELAVELVVRHRVRAGAD